MSEYVLSLSYGKDSLACLGAIEELGLPLDRIVHAEVWATETIHADLPPMVEFKAKADRIIKERYGFEVEHYKAKHCFESAFYRLRGDTGRKSKFEGKVYGWPMVRGQWCLQQLKLPALKEATRGDVVQYIGIAADEPNRFHNLSERNRSPLVEAGWDEAKCRKWCEDNGVEVFTFYAARHTWASLARKEGIDKSTIDDCLGHRGSYQAADIYAEKAWELMQEANGKVLGLFTWGHPTA